MSDKYFDPKIMKELKLLMESRAFDQIRREASARGLRGEVTANWLDSFMNRMYRNEVDRAQAHHLVDAKTGKPHTVETLVADLRERVRLDVILKSSEEEIPLSKKMAEQMYAADMQKITQVIDNFLSSHRGHADDQAILYHLRDTFGEEAINKISDQIMKKIEQLKKENIEPIVNNDAIEDAALGQPLKLDEQDLKKDEQIFTSIQDGLSRKN